MIEEPYRWVEAIANRREYIEHQLASGSPIVALSYREGILLFTLGRERQKLFEIYDRIGMGGIGHPGDIERLRMKALELASAEGFARSACDVSLRRLATYALSSALKAAFEQIYGPPHLVRMLFVELGRGTQPNLFLRLDYDGSIQTNGGLGTRGPRREFGVLSGKAAASARMEHYLQSHHLASAPLESALRVALDAWTIGQLEETSVDEQFPEQGELARLREAHLEEKFIEAAVLKRDSPLPMTWCLLLDEEVRAGLSSAPVLLT